jgi:hypothetical protein
MSHRSISARLQYSHQEAEPPRCLTWQGLKLVEDLVKEARKVRPVASVFYKVMVGRKRPWIGRASEGRVRDREGGSGPPAALLRSPTRSRRFLAHRSEQKMEGRSVQSSEQRRDALVERIFGSSIGFMEILSIYAGDRLGFYRALADNGGATASELADITVTHERYAREWLQHPALPAGGDGRAAVSGYGPFDASSDTAALR